MKRLILVLLLCGTAVQMRALQRDSLLVMFWNMENFFDWIDQGTGDSDREFSSYGGRYWTKSRFYDKCDAVAKSMLWICERYGRMPDVIGLAEIENRGVLAKLLNYTLLRKYDYSIVHKESSDRRGIDVALLYRRSSMSLQSSSFKAPDNLSTRDILHASMILNDGRNIHFLVNHHPSKFGGEKNSEDRRKAAIETLKEMSDSLRNSSGDGIMIMGDFNDTPDGKQFEVMGNRYENKGLPLHEDGKGTIRYKGRWELIDFFISDSHLHTSDMEVVRIPFLMTYDKRYPGEKPLRTYSGPRYIGGVSDHCPIVIVIPAVN